MKTIKLCLPLIVLLAASCVTVKDYPLAKNGKPASCIVLPDNAGPAEKHAAKELAGFLEKVTGAKVAVENKPAKKLYNIYLGTSAAGNIPRCAAIDQAIARLKDDGFVVAADKKGLRVIGNKPAGVLFGVYALLKDYAGMRWFAPGAEFEYCPQQSTVTVPEQVTVSNPSFKVRNLAFICADMRAPITNTWDWMVRNGIPITVNKDYYIKSEPLRKEADKRGVEYGREGGHSFAYLLSDGLFAAHPEYFALIDGKRTKQDIGDGKGARYQPCTSNPKVAEIMTASIDKTLDSPLKGGRYLIGNNDATNWCQCVECAKLDPPDEKQKGFVGTRYWTLVNKIAAEVYKTHPEIEIWGWGYQNFQYPPTGIVPDPRITVQFCAHGRCFRHPMEDLACKYNDRYRDILVQWGKLKNTICILEYLGGDCGFPAYVPFEKSYAADLKYYKKIGLSGVSLFMVAPDSNLIAPWNIPFYREEMLTAWQMYYITARLLWDVDADYDQIYEDMGAKYYGITWPAMKAYRALLTKAFMEITGRVGDCTPQSCLDKCLDRPGVEDQLLRFLDQAVKLAGNDRTAIQRVTRDREYLHKYWPTALNKKMLAGQHQEFKANKRRDSIVIDGMLGEADWQNSAVQSDFLVIDGKTAADPKTIVRIVYDEDNIYFGAEALEPEPGKMQTNIKERDGQVWLDSSLEIFICAPKTGSKLARIVINPKGVVYDGMGAVAWPRFDPKFDSGLEAKAAMLKDRWIAEIRIPGAAFGGKIRDGAKWKLNVVRNRRLTDGTEQSSTWCNGVVYGWDVFRPVIWGDMPLVQNGDFEDSIEATPAHKKEGWQYLDNRVAEHWTFCSGHPGASSLVGSDAASGARFLRIKDGACYSLINQAADYRGDLRVRAKVRGKGALAVYIYYYERSTGKFIRTQSIHEREVDSQEWTDMEAIYKCAGDNILRLAFHVKGEIDIDAAGITSGANRPAVQCP